MTDRITREVEAALDKLYRGGRLGLAVSGGGDSVALLHIASGWAAARDVALAVATVDHGLRPESAAEAAGVGALAAKLDLPHRVLTWTDWDGRGNLQAAARNARRRLLVDWAREESCSAVLLGHTLDDQAETVLMRLGRGSGVDGLSAMTAEAEVEGVRWLRPIIGQKREALRDWLAARGKAWIDDPSNENARFDRVKARQALVALADLGVSAEGLAATAEKMREAREALEHATLELAKKTAQWGHCGELRLSLSPLRQAPPELARRLLRVALAAAGGSEYGARGEAERKLMIAMLALRLGGGRALHGCLVRPNGVDGVLISREVAAVDAKRQAPPGEGRLWDGRFKVAAAPGLQVGPLGEGGAQCLAAAQDAGAWTPPDGWLAAPRAARLTTPALWRGDELAAAPVAEFGADAEARFAAAEAGWFAKI